MVRVSFRLAIEEADRETNCKQNIYFKIKVSTNKIDKLKVDQETYLRLNNKKEGKQQHKENKTNCRKVDSLKKKLASKALFFKDVLDL